MKNDQALSLTCIGSLLVDDIAKPLQILHAGASNPVSWSQSVGGVAANVARAAAVCVKTTLISAAGNDLPAVLSHPNLNTVDCHWITRDKPFDRYTAVLNESGDLFLGLASTELAESISLSDILAQIKAPTTAFAIDANLNGQCLRELVDYIKSTHPNTIIAALPVSPEKAVKWQASAAEVDVLFCNRQEAAALTGQPPALPIDELANALARMGFGCFVLTDAGKPIRVRQHNQLTNVVVPQVAITGNVNGAGDALAGATLAHFLTRHKLVESTSIAGLAAARCVLNSSTLNYPKAT